MDKKKIYVICPDRDKPLGGVKQLYRLVDVLNSLGHEAYVLHKKKNFRVTWYTNNTAVINFAGVFKKLNWYKKNFFMQFIEGLLFGKKMPEEGSILVFPEIYGPHINYFSEYSIVIFNQNCYYTFEQFPPFKLSFSPYNNSNLLGCLVVSKDSENYLSQFYPQVKTNRIRIGLSETFSYSSKKKKQIAFMPRKLAEDANQIYQFLYGKDYFKEWEFVAIDGLNEEQVASLLKESAIFLSFNHREGFGLPPVEAMACGCFVIGYTGNAGEEYFKPEFSIKVADRNILDFLSKLENTIIQYNNNPTELLNKGKLASEYILSIYNKDNEHIDIENAWKRIAESN